MQGPILFQKRAHFLSACVQFNLGFVSTTSLQKISNWKQCSEWKKTLPLYAGMHSNDGAPGKVGHGLLMALAPAAFAPALLGWPPSAVPSKGQGSCVCTCDCTCKPSDTEVSLQSWTMDMDWDRVYFPRQRCLFQLCLLLCAPAGDSPQANPHAYTVGQRGIRRQGREESSIQRHKMPKNILIVTHLLHAVLCLLHSFSTVVTLHPQ